MVDLHAHFLPGIDDGARNLSETVAMMRVAVQAGTTDLVATPHADVNFLYDAREVERLLQLARVSAPPGLRLHRGCDFHMMGDNLAAALKHPRRFTVNGGRYLLVEFSELVIWEGAEDSFRQLEGVGVVPIVTHPERNPLLRRRLDLLKDWVCAGRLMQLTASSLLGHWGGRASKCCHEMLSLGLVHFIASDGHGPQDRPPKLDRAYAKIAFEYGTGAAERLFRTNPRAVIHNRQIAPAEPLERRRGWWRRLHGAN